MLRFIAVWTGLELFSETPYIKGLLKGEIWAHRKAHLLT